MTITVETIRKYKQEIIKESCGCITNPEHQAVVMTVYDLINYLQEEHESDYLEDYDELWDEDGEFDDDVYSEKFDEIWNEEGMGEFQEAVADYSGMTTWTVEIGNEYYFIGNIEDLEEEALLDYASWYNEDEDEDEE